MPKIGAFITVSAATARAVAVGATVAVVVGGLMVWPQVQEMMYWNGVQCNELKGVHLYLEKYPGGQYEREAKVCLTAEALKRAFSAYLRRDVSFYAKDDDGLTDLHYVSAANMPELAKILLDWGANVQAKDKGGETPLHNAARNNARETAQLLISHGADVQAKDEGGETPLHKAARNNARETAQLLISHRAYVQAKNVYGKTPQDIAIAQDHAEMTQLLR